ncbi:MAG: leucyl/phenylalanyl-tRNA--protein transferase [Georgfuchsia sp.]
MIPWLDEEITFPPLDAALNDPPGLLAAGGDLSPQRLIAAYRRGIFPWYAPGNPILWWSPDPRMVLHPDELKISRSLARTLRNVDYEVRLDSACGEVIHACATVPRQGQPGTWITDEMQKAYLHLHELGYAHSVETWIDGKLAGGLYGVALGRAFFGESMFSCVCNASKIALAHLCAYLHQRDFGIIDCQMETAHLTSLGARPISRGDFVAELSLLVDSSAPPGLWPMDGIRDCFHKISTDETDEPCRASPGQEVG